MHAQDWFLAVLGFFLPPIPVLIKRGFTSADFWINIALCLLGFIPGLLHSWYIISCYPYESGHNLSHANRITHPGNTNGGYGSI